jgi:hypothetical protein
MTKTDIESEIETLVKELTKSYDAKKVDRLHDLRIKLEQVSRKKRRTQDVFIQDIIIYVDFQQDF